MALHTLGTNTTTSLPCLAAWSQVLSQADIAAIGQAITEDNDFATIVASGQIGPQGVLTTGSTHSNTTVDTLVGVSGGPLGTIQVGDLVLGTNIPPGTFVAAILSGTSVQLSQAATDSVAGKRIAFIRQGGEENAALGSEGILIFPGGRGSMRLLVGDVVAVDNTGWPTVVSGASIAYPGSQWTFT